MHELKQIAPGQFNQRSWGIAADWVQQNEWSSVQRFSHGYVILSVWNEFQSTIWSSSVHYSTKLQYGYRLPTTQWLISKRIHKHTRAHRSRRSSPKSQRHRCFQLEWNSPLFVEQIAVTAVKKRPKCSYPMHVHMTDKIRTKPRCHVLIRGPANNAWRG